MVELEQKKVEFEILKLQTEIEVLKIQTQEKKSIVSKILVLANLLTLLVGIFVSGNNWYIKNAEFKLAKEKFEHEKNIAENETTIAEEETKRARIVASANTEIELLNFFMDNYDKFFSGNKEVATNVYSVAATFNELEGLDAAFMESFTSTIKSIVSENQRNLFEDIDKKIKNNKIKIETYSVWGDIINLNENQELSIWVSILGKDYYADIDKVAKTYKINDIPGKDKQSINVNYKINKEQTKMKSDRQLGTKIDINL